MTIKKKIISSFIGSGAAAGLNMLTTIIILRWFGEETFTNYLVDLAYIAIISIIIELIPSSFSVFKIQDDKKFQNSIALFSIISAIVIFFITLLLLKTNLLFLSSSIFIAAYAPLLSVKKIFDIKLQAEGKLKTFFMLESVIALMRLSLIIGLSRTPLQSSDTLWLSIFIATITTYLIWTIKNSSEFDFQMIFTKESAIGIFKYRNEYPAYYMGIAIKKIKDNLITISAPLILTNKEALAAFFIAYRGLIFSAGQIRVIEAFLTNRAILAESEKIRKFHIIATACTAQIACTFVIIGMSLMSGIESIDMLSLFILGLTCWIYTAFSRLRAKLLSRYNQHTLNIATVVGLFAMGGGQIIAILLFENSIQAICLSILMAELASVIIMYIHSNRKKND